MKLTRGEFCQFNLNTRLELLKEFGKNIIQKRISMKLISVYEISGFYVEVYENLISHQLEKVEPVKNIHALTIYRDL
jgi:hypothetical protein